ncbi:MAG: hypothetical protein LBS88_03050 [Tannerellaceae bacterium]|jgi:hypothetical protein|nr:hypothetical protein [Tannerellaceae bacterium]
MSNNNKTKTDELTEIRDLMERSSICISLSGLGGIFAGICVLAGVAAGSLLSPGLTGDTLALLGWGGGIFLSSLLCIICFSYRRSKAMKTKLWNSPTRRLVVHLAVPFTAGAWIVLKLLLLGLFDLVPATSLIVYGIAVFSAGHYSPGESRRLAYGEMLLGAVALVFPTLGWLCWVVGFGILHILFGGIMWNKHERKEGNR